jgi:hypothetical protein
MKYYIYAKTNKEALKIIKRALPSHVATGITTHKFARFIHTTPKGFKISKNLYRITTRKRR